MSDRELNVVEFHIPSEKWGVESFDTSNPPRKGETVEAGAKFVDGERIDPGIVKGNEWFDADYETVLRGVVGSVKRHYHTSTNRTECSVKVELVDVVYNDGQPIDKE